MNTEKLMPRHPFREGDRSTKSRAETRKARLRAIGLDGPEGGATFSQPEAPLPNSQELTDSSIVDQFVEGVLSLSDNLNLKIEAINHTSYLTTYEGVTIASINLAEAAPFALVKRDSPYWHLVNQSLLKHHYMPLSQTWQQEFIRYEQQELPDGYVMNFTQAGYLYQTWLQRQSPFDLLLFMRQNWYPIRAITAEQSTLTIQTLVAEGTAESADWLIWLSTPEDQAILHSLTQACILEEIPAMRSSSPFGVIAPELPDSDAAVLDLPVAEPDPVATDSAVTKTTATILEFPLAAPEPSEAKPATSLELLVAEPDDIEFDHPAREIEPLAFTASTPEFVEPGSEPIPLEVPSPPSPSAIATPATQANDWAETGTPAMRSSSPVGIIAPPVQPIAKTPQTVLSFQDGRLHITTAAGEVVVEGTDLRFWVCPQRQ